MVAKAIYYLIRISIFFILTACSINTGTMLSSNTYSGSSLNATRTYPIDLVWKSSVRTLDSLKISITERSHDQNTAILKGITTQDNSVKINIKSINSNTTRISIRVGVFGEEIMSREILRRIDNNLEILNVESYRRESSNNVY